ncbi:MAG: amidohydrolase family protein [Fimbriiglobus sp.]
MIDVHIHLVPPRLPGVGSLHRLLRETPVYVAQELRTQMRAAGLTHVLAMGEWNCTPEDPLGIETTLAFRDMIPGLHAIGIMDPAKGHDREHLRAVEAVMKLGQVVALKGYLGYLHFEPAHAGYRPYYELAAKYKLPVVFHTGDTFSPYAKLKFAHPLGVDEVAVDHPETKFVLAHLGNPWIVDAAEVVYKNMNVWADLSGLLVGDADLFTDEERADTRRDIQTQLARAFRYAERPTRFLFGTDWPLIPIAEYREFIAQSLPEMFHEDIFITNAQQLFRIA